MSREKTLGNTTASQAVDNVKDIKFWGNGDMWKLISKAWSVEEGWMKSTKAMEIYRVGCLVQVTTQVEEIPSEAVVFVPGVMIFEIKNKKGVIIGRKLIKIKE